MKKKLELLRIFRNKFMARQRRTKQSTGVKLPKLKRIELRKPVHKRTKYKMGK